MREVEGKFLLLLRSALGTNGGSRQLSISTDEEQEILRLARIHDLSHLIHLGAKSTGIDSIASATKQYYLKAIKRKSQQEFTLIQASRILEHEKINFIPLKGSVLCNIYPEKWMRISSDIDVLVKNDDYKNTINVLSEDQGFSEGEECTYHKELVGKDGTIIEIHRMLGDVLDSEESEQLEFANDIWNHSFLKTSDSCEYCINDEWFYLYQIIHMVNHFKRGGIGIKFFIDLWLMNYSSVIELTEEKKKARTELLEEYGYLKFEETSLSFARKIIEGINIEVDETFERFVFNAGAFGSSKQKAEMNTISAGSKTKLIKKRIFMPYNELRWSYPILNKHKWLTPFFEVVRWFRIIFKNEKKAKAEFESFSKTDYDSVDKVVKMCQNLGL